MGATLSGGGEDAAPTLMGDGGIMIAMKNSMVAITADLKINRKTRRCLMLIIVPPITSSHYLGVLPSHYNFGN
jgi:hypothetical protein